MDGLQKQHGDALRVERLNVAEDVGRTALRRLGGHGLPFTVWYDPDGAEVYRADGRVPRPAAIRETLAAISIPRT